MLGRELPDPARRRVDALEEVVERQPAVHRDDDLAVEHESAGAEAGEHLLHVGEITRERLARLGLEPDGIAVAEGEAAEAVPFRLEEPVRTSGELVGRLRLHRFEGKAEREAHSFSRSNRPRFCSSGFQRSPILATRAGTLSRRKSATSKPFSISSQVTGVETAASGLGRTE